MEYNELVKLINQENEERYNTLKKCLFDGTEHQAGGGVVQAYDYIYQLLDDGYFTMEGLLRCIGRYGDMKRCNNTNCNKRVK